MLHIVITNKSGLPNVQAIAIVVNRYPMFLFDRSNDEGKITNRPKLIVLFSELFIL